MRSFCPRGQILCPDGQLYEFVAEKTRDVAESQPAIPIGITPTEACSRDRDATAGTSTYLPFEGLPCPVASSIPAVVTVRREHAAKQRPIENGRVRRPAHIPAQRPGPSQAFHVRTSRRQRATSRRNVGPCLDSARRTVASGMSRKRPTRGTRCPPPRTSEARVLKPANSGASLLLKRVLSTEAGDPASSLSTKSGISESDIGGPLTSTTVSACGRPQALVSGS